MTKFLSKIKNAIKIVETQTSLFRKKNRTYKVECSIDDEEVDCKELKESYLGVPAPIVLPDDPWFGSAPKSQKAIRYEQKVTSESKIKEEQKKEIAKEPENIHQVMYKMVTQSWTTIGETQGGSENIQEGPGGWNSGNRWGKII